MENNIFTKTNLIVFLVVVLATVILAWLVLPKMITLTVPSQEVKPAEHEAVPEEHFEEGMEGMEGVEGMEEIHQEMTDKNKPYVNPQTGSIIDGPGFEKGEVEGIAQESMATIPSNYYFLDDGNGGNDSIQHNLCSKSCCSAQWPTPFKQKFDPYVCGNKDQFVPSQIMCNNSFQDSGCLCLTKSQAQHIYNRGGNGREFF